LQAATAQEVALRVGSPARRRHAELAAERFLRERQQWLLHRPRQRVGEQVHARQVAVECLAGLVRHGAAQREGGRSAAAVVEACAVASARAAAGVE